MFWKRFWINYFMNKVSLFLLFFFFTFICLNSSKAVEPDEILLNKELEYKARKISKELRCLVCQNEDIDSSNADIAKDLRLLVREKLLNGEKEKEIINYVHKKYGDYVLFKPPVKFYTIILWMAPFLLLIFFSIFFFRKR